ncbi:MAG TPA: hypothetical protein VIU46_06695 [Gallionellaceae bacterium]
MKFLRILLLLALSITSFAPAAIGAEELASSEKRLVGIWQEYQPNANVVQFFPDHTMRIYLTKEEREKMKINFIQANWAVSPESILTLNFSANGKSFSQSIKVEYQGEEMWLVDEGKTTTKHQRLSGEIPEKFKW